MANHVDGRTFLKINLINLNKSVEMCRYLETSPTP